MFSSYLNGFEFTNVQIIAAIIIVVVIWIAFLVFLGMLARSITVEADREELEYKNRPQPLPSSDDEDLEGLGEGPCFGFQVDRVPGDLNPEVCDALWKLRCDPFRMGPLQAYARLEYELKRRKMDRLCIPEEEFEAEWGESERTKHVYATGTGPVLTCYTASVSEFTRAVQVLVATAASMPPVDQTQIGYRGHTYTLYMAYGQIVAVWEE